MSAVLSRESPPDNRSHRVNRDFDYPAGFFFGREFVRIAAAKSVQA